MNLVRVHLPQIAKYQHSISHLHLYHTLSQLLQHIQQQPFADINFCSIAAFASACKCLVGSFLSTIDRGGRPQSCAPATMWTPGSGFVPEPPSGYNLTETVDPLHPSWSIPRTFFFNISSHYPAIFSTLNGTREKRTLDPDSLPAPIARNDLANDVHSKANYLRIHFPTWIMSVRTPGAWADLHHWFDATDLWVEGAPFLYIVLNYIHRQNEEIVRMWEFKTAEINQWVNSWVSANEFVVATVPDTQDLTTSFSVSENQEYQALDPSDKQLFQQVLNQNRRTLKAKWIEHAKFQQLSAQPMLPTSMALHSDSYYSHSSKSSQLLMDV